MKNKELKIYAGPCSVDSENIAEIYQISEIKVNAEKAIYGTRVVGLKSRTELSVDGSGMGMDIKAIQNNVNLLTAGKSADEFEQLPSVMLAEKIHNETGLNIASEILLPQIQLPLLGRVFTDGGLMPWNPAVNQSGWSLLEMAEYARKFNWDIGIKNAKWVGDDPLKADTANYERQTPLEKVWAGLVKYVGNISGETILIHRGVDVPEKGDYRNLPVHEIAKRTKVASGAKLYFDPSHSYGPKMREDIVRATIAALQLKVSETEYLYDGILIEVGTSKTDTEQHISITELEQLVTAVADFREVKSR